MNRKRYIAIFCINEGNNQVVLGKKAFKPTNNKISYKDKTFLIDIKKPTYIKNLTLYYFYNINSGLILLNKKESTYSLNPDIMDKVMSQNIINQLTAGLMDKKIKANLIIMIFFCLFGGLIGYIIGSSI